MNMKNKLTAKLPKCAGKKTRSRSIDRGVLGSDELPFIKREFTSSNGSPRKRKVRLRTQIHSPTIDIPRLNHPKKPRKLFEEQSFEIYEEPPSIKREPSFEEDAKIERARMMSAGEMPGNFTASSQNEVLPAIKRELSFENSAEIKTQIVKTGRKTSSKETSKNKKKKVSSKNKMNPSITAYSAKVKKENREARHLKTHSEKQWSPQETPPSTPYALNRPQRNRIRPLAYWRGEYRSFRTLVNGDIVLVDFHIPEYSEEPQRKRRKLSEK